MSDERFTEIEVKLAHQEQLLIDLDKVITDQQASIMRLEELCDHLVERLRSIGDGSTDAPHADKPPHY